MKKSFNNFLKFSCCVFLNFFFLFCFNVVLAEENNPANNNPSNSQPATVFSSPNSATSANTQGKSTSQNSNTTNNSAPKDKTDSSTKFSNNSQVAISSPPSNTKQNANSSNNNSNTKSSVGSQKPSYSKQISSNNATKTKASTNASQNNEENDQRTSQQKEPTSQQQTAQNNNETELSENVASNETTSQVKQEDKNLDEKAQKPEDLPPAEDSEMEFPEVVSAENAEKNGSNNLFAGIIAWGCILIGVAIVIFVMINGKSNEDVPIQAITGTKKRKRKGKHLLPNDYYRDKF